MQSLSIVVLLLLYIVSWQEYNESMSNVEIDFPISVSSDMLVDASEKLYNILMSKLVSLKVSSCLCGQILSIASSKTSPEP